VTRDRLPVFVFFALLLFCLYEALVILTPFFGPLLCALATAIVCYPLHHRLQKLLKKRSTAFQAFISDLGVFLFLMVPLVFLVIAMFSEIQNALPALKTHGTGFVQNVQRFVDGKRVSFIPVAWQQNLSLRASTLQAKIAAAGEQGLGTVAQLAAGAAKNIFGFLADSVIYLIVLFFLFKDGDELYRQWSDLLPFSSGLKHRIHDRIRGTVEGVVRSAVVIGLVQGFFFLVGYLIISFRAAVLFSCLTAFASLLPGIGAAIIWGPLALYYQLSQSIWKALVLIAFGALTAFVDSFIRPWLVGRKAEMPFVWLLFAVLGGLEVFGAKGLILGPLVFALLPVLLDIYKSYIHDHSTPF
jgi:predicted PurR-regulated permease PerM